MVCEGLNGTVIHHVAIRGQYGASGAGCVSHHPWHSSVAIGDDFQHTDSYCETSGAVTVVICRDSRYRRSEAAIVPEEGDIVGGAAVCAGVTLQLVRQLLFEYIAHVEGVFEIHLDFCDFSSAFGV